MTENYNCCSANFFLSIKYIENYFPFYKIYRKPFSFLQHDLYWHILLGLLSTASRPMAETKQFFCLKNYTYNNVSHKKLLNNFSDKKIIFFSLNKHTQHLLHYTITRAIFNITKLQLLNLFFFFVNVFKYFGFINIVSRDFTPPFSPKNNLQY